MLKFRLLKLLVLVVVICSVSNYCNIGYSNLYDMNLEKNNITKRLNGNYCHSEFIISIIDDEFFFRGLKCGKIDVLIMPNGKALKLSNIILTPLNY